MLRSVLRHNSLVSQLATVNEDNVDVPDDASGALGLRPVSPDDLVGTPVSAGSDHSESRRPRVEVLSFNLPRDGGLEAWSNTHAHATRRRDSASSASSGFGRRPRAAESADGVCLPRRRRRQPISQAPAAVPGRLGRIGDRRASRQRA